MRVGALCEAREEPDERAGKGRERRRGLARFVVMCSGVLVQPLTSAGSREGAYELTHDEGVHWVM